MPLRLMDLALPLPVVNRRTTALEAARRIAGDRLSALVVAGDDGTPAFVVPAVDVLGLLIPLYLREDTRLAGVLDESAAEELWGQADRRTIGELLDSEDVRVYDILRVDPDATLVEVATLMAAAHTSIALVEAEHVHRGHGTHATPAGDRETDEPRAVEEVEPHFITLPTVLDAALTARGGGRTA
ncbi:hypothetical protein Q6348_02570 [Isoptericola sp. b441]|uniref:CBS domain-containing protein n=1 Tax=Actinotalea lenta TaxID=3064654 RepID=A0ABT9DAV9_9CELL|nr:MULTISPECIES: hypothetical protein [unclassified Isoptericola]MDO8106077.1 hypothetical protein [Isoptericola sp. b441]MDO8122204.1 hypothetical protein [Isoptericola sp. b490]